jgi:cytochrome b561
VRYTTTAIALHWIIGVAVLGQIAFGWWMQEIPKDPVGPRVNAFNLHKSIGLTILALMARRLIWRAMYRPPALPAMPAWQARAARINHRVLYTCLFLQPRAATSARRSAAIQSGISACCRQPGGESVPLKVF